METSKSASQFILKGPSDWKVWISRIRAYARGTGVDVWGIIDPESTAQETLTKPVKPSPEAVKPSAEGIDDLDQNQLARLDYLFKR